jgi:putative endonuclease
VAPPQPGAVSRGRAPSPDRRLVGPAGEAAALAHLTASGLRVVARDWRCRLGQLDLVCEEAGVLVAVEVKARRGNRFGLPQEAVDRRKQASGRGDQPCRIDVVAVRMDRELRLLSCEHIRDAVGG